jgi:hypothetical protein
LTVGSWIGFDELFDVLREVVVGALATLNESVTASGNERTRRYTPFIGLIFWIACLGALFGGCAVKLAPDYDKAIFDGLTRVNEDTMTLFVSVGTGPYSQRVDSYNSVLGGLDALQVQVMARQTPNAPAIFGTLLQSADDRQKVADALTPPTSAAVTNMSRIVTRLRADDQRGRAAGRIDFLKEAFAVQMAQALTYEKALQR